MVHVPMETGSDVALRPRVLSLCAGAGGLDLGFKLAVPTARTVCYVEIEAYAAAVLAARIKDKALDDAPIWSDLRTFDARRWRGSVDWVIGGYPCQPFSQAGKRLGADDPRHLWPHIARILRECEAPAAFFENVQGHVSLGLREVRVEMEDMGYHVEAELVRAEEVGAPHRRSRVFILAYTDSARLWDESGRAGGQDGTREAVSVDNREAVADTSSNRRSQGDRNEPGTQSDATTGQPERRGSPMVNSSSIAKRESQHEGSAVSRGDARSDTGGGRDAVGDANSARLEGRSMRGGKRANECATGETGCALGDPDDGAHPQRRISDATRGEVRGIAGSGCSFPPGPEDADGWRGWHGPQPAIRRDANGLANRVDELRLCGGGVVPQQAAYAFDLLRRRVT